VNHIYIHERGKSGQGNEDSAPDNEKSGMPEQTDDLPF
jgi:hypothetical protein